MPKKHYLIETEDDAEEGEIFACVYFLYHEFYKLKCLGAAEDNIKDGDSRKIRNKALTFDDSGCCFDGCNRCCRGMCTQRLCPDKNNFLF